MALLTLAKRKLSSSKKISSDQHSGVALFRQESQRDPGDQSAERIENPGICCQ